MPVARGRVSFVRLGISGDGARTVGADALERLAAGVIGVGGTAISNEVEAGWTAGEHILDDRFDHEKNILADGACARLGLRIDTNRLPSEIKRALRAQHEAAVAGTHGGVLTRAGKREAKELTEHAVLDELASGKHRRSAMVDLLWDAPRGTVLSAAAGQGVLEALRGHWKASLGGAVTPESAGTVGWRLASAHGAGRWFEDARPTAFVPAPEGAASERPDAPWCHSGGSGEDWLGNEMMLWLWWRAEAGEGIQVVLDGGERVEAEVAIEGPIELECPWGVGGKLTAKAHEEGVPAPRLREVREALRTGKQPRRVGLMLSDGELAWRMAFQADRWLVSACELPVLDDDDELDARALLEARVDRMRRLDSLLLGLMGAFIEARRGNGWDVQRQALSAWVRGVRAETPKVGSASRAGVLEGA